MRLHKEQAGPSERAAVIRNIRWCRKHHLALAGLPYDDPLVGPDGIHLVIIAPQGTSSEHLEQAIREGRDSFDVVSHASLICPPAWFDEAKEEA